MPRVSPRVSNKDIRSYFQSAKGNSSSTSTKASKRKIITSDDEDDVPQSPLKRSKVCSASFNPFSANDDIKDREDRREKMSGFTNIELADIHYVYGEACADALRARAIYAERFPDRRLPDRKTFLRVDQTARNTGSLGPERSVGRQQQDADLGYRLLNQIENDPTSSTRRIALRDMSLPYQPVQQLEEGDPERRMAFCAWMLRKLRKDKFFLSRILFTGEVGFDRNGVFNIHNEDVRSTEDTHTVAERNSQRQFSCNVWAGIVDECLVGPVVLPNRLTGQYYLEFLRNELPDQLEDVPLSTRRGMWYMHDGAPSSHSTNDVSNYLNSIFGEKWIGRGGPVPWPARSPDLNPMEYCFWGHFKTIVYSTPVNTREELIRRVIFTGGVMQHVTADLKKIENDLRRRLELCLEQQGGHFEDLF